MTPFLILIRYFEQTFSLKWTDKSNLPAWYHSGVKHRRGVWIFLLIIIISNLSSCSSIAETDLLDRWQYTDLRLLDPNDAALTSHDLIAAYLREDNGDLQIRLDLLEASNYVDYDLYLAFDLMPGGIRRLPFEASSQILWDTLLSIPANGSIELQKSDGSELTGSQAVVIRDVKKTAVLINLKREIITDQLVDFPITRELQVQVFLTPATSKEIADQTNAFKLDDSPPEPIHVLMTFWNTYPAYTPASALRRWDGAHTGPNGGRHGLYNLLRTADANDTPLFMLDLNNPMSISALDFGGWLPSILELQSQNLLVLPSSVPDLAYGPVIISPKIKAELSDWSKRVSSDFGIKDQGFSYTPDGFLEGLPDEELIFLPIPPAGSDFSIAEVIPGSIYPGLTPLRWKRGALIPFYQFASETDEIERLQIQAEREGLSTVWKQILLQNAIALNLDRSHLKRKYINLGGELPNSSWGDPASARASFRWIREHPWVRVLDNHELTTLNRENSTLMASLENETGQIYSKITGEALERALDIAPTNPLRLAALQTLHSLYAPIFPYSADLPAMRKNYLGQVWSLLAASEWAENPAEISTCEADPDRDGENECILASHGTYAQFEILDGSLTYLFAFKPAASKPGSLLREVHLLSGPSSMTITGLSSPANWKLDDGLSADPEVIAGAFLGPWTGYQTHLEQNALTFSLPDDSYKKTFRLIQSGIIADISQLTSGPVQKLQIPILFDPWLRFSPGWANNYSRNSNDNEIIWSFAGKTSVVLRSSTQLHVSDFLESRDFFSSEEDPNFDYPKGHFLPFPLALVDIIGYRDFQVRLEIQIDG